MHIPAFHAGRGSTVSGRWRDIGKEESEELLRQLVSRMSDRAVFFFTGVRKATLELIKNAIRDQQKPGIRVADVGISIEQLADAIDTVIDEFGRPVRNPLIDVSVSQDPQRMLQLDANRSDFVGNNCEQHGRVVIISDHESTARFIIPSIGRAAEYLPRIGWTEYPQVLELSVEHRQRWLEGELSVHAQAEPHKAFAMAG